MSEPKPLSIAEQSEISTALLTIIKDYTGFPSTIPKTAIHFQYLEDTENIGVFSLQGAVYTAKYVSGNFTAQFPFEILYKCKPTNNGGMIDGQNVLDLLGEWLETIDYPALTGGRTIEKIERISTTILVGKDDSGMSLFRCAATLKYSKKG